MRHPTLSSQMTLLGGLSEITLSRGHVKERVPLGRSLMPEGLLDGLNDQALRDLFAYLRSGQPFLKD